MAQHPVVSNGRAPGLFTVAVGILLAVVPLAYLSPGGIGVGPIGFAVLMIEVIMGVIGFGVILAGGYSYRTENPRPAVAVASSVISLVIVGGIGAYVEMTGGPLIPIWAWTIAGLAAIALSLALSFEFTSSD